MRKLRMLEEALSTAAKDYGIDWSIETDVAHECLWGMEVRITPKPNTKEAPDISTVLLIGGGQIRKTAPGKFCHSSGSS